MSSSWYVNVVLLNVFALFTRGMRRGCQEVFVRVQQLQSHFEHAHRELFNKRVSLDALAPLAILAPPRRLRLPPPLPSCRTQLLLPLVSIPPRWDSQPTASQGLTRKWSRLNVQDNESDDDPIAFDDFTSLQRCSISEPEVVLELLPGRQSLLSRSQPVVYPPIRYSSPEQSILYPRFTRMVDHLVATGALAGHKEGET